MLVQGGHVRENLIRAVQFIRRASSHQAQIVLLPEALDLGWTHPCALDEAGGIPDGHACSVLRSAAREFGVHVCAGLVERSGARLFNSAVLISPDGGILLHHRKLNELEIGHGFYAQGDRLAVAETPLGTIGLMICSDAFVRGQVVGRTLGLMGADLILSPCAWAVPEAYDVEKTPYGELWSGSYGPVARDFHLWIAGISNVGVLSAGPWKGRPCIGNSMVVGPDGAVVRRGAFGKDAEELILVEVQTKPRPARGAGWDAV